MQISSESEVTFKTTESIRYKVVVNHEEQYSLWLDGRDNAPGWKDTGMAGIKAECLAYIRNTWTDMRPLSLRKAMSGNSFLGANRASLCMTE